MQGRKKMGRKSRTKKERRKQREQAQQAKMASGNTSLQKGDEQEVLRKVLTERAESGLDKQTDRILAVLGVSSEDDAEVNDETLETYFDYLKEHLEIPCTITGIEDMGCFGWEEYYTFGPGNQREYERLKKKYPSYTDEYELLGFSDDFDEEEGIFVHVRRISDKKKFTLPLADLEGVGEHPRNDQLLNDYVVWFVNYR